MIQSAKIDRSHSSSPQAGSTGQIAPAVELRVAALTFAQGGLLTFVSVEGQNRHLPNTVPIEGESLDATAARLLRTNLGFSEQYMEQLYTLSHSDSGRWSIIVSYLALICTEGELSDPEQGAWVDLGSVESLSESRPAGR